MARLIILIAIGLVLYFTWQWFKSLPPSQQKSARINIALWAALIILTVLMLTGRMHWLGAVLAALVTLARPLMPYLLKFIPAFIASKAQAGQQAHHAQSSQMNLDEAYATLGLKKGASKQAIIVAHRMLMSKLHPDKGGNDFLAAKINTAKQVVIESLS